MRTWIMLLFCWLVGTTLHGQAQNPDEQAATWLGMADSLNFIGEYQDALSLAQQALESYTRYYGKNDLKLAKAYQPMSEAALRLWDLEKGIEYARRGLEILSLAEQQEIALTQQLNILALCYYYLGNYQAANMYYDRISRLLYQKFGTYNHDQFIGTLSNQGACYYQMQDFERAEELFQKSLAIVLNNHGSMDERIIGKYNNLGNVQLAKQNYHQALGLFQKSLAIKTKILPPHHSFLTTSYNNLGECYTKIERPAKALYFYHQALQIYQHNEETCSLNYAESLCSIGAIHQAQANYAAAERQYQKALQTMQTCYTQSPPILATIYSHLASVALAQEKMKLALQSFEQAFVVLAFDPKLEKTYKNRNTGVRLLAILEQRIACLEKEYRRSATTKFLEQALADASIAIEIIDFLRIQFLENKAKLQLLDTYYPIFTKAINYCYQLHQVSGEEHWLRRAFQFSEQSKSVVLLETLYKTNGILSTGIPDSLIEQEQSLRLGISFYEKQIYRSKLAEQKTQQALDHFSNKLFDLKQSYTILMNKLEREYPAYFQLKYKRQIASVAKVQKILLQDQEALLEYFVGAKEIFCFLITRAQIKVVKIDKDFPLLEWIKGLRKNITSYPNRLLEPQDQEAAALAKMAFALYQKLLQPLATDLVGMKQLRIIPDGVLGYLPFEVLLERYPTHLSKYRSYDFLLRKFALSYSFSASVLQRDLLHPTTAPQKNLIAFAPRFQTAATWSTQRSFGNLRFNTKEVERIAHLLDADLYLADQATEAKFIQEAKNYKIIHLATHAQTNDQENNYSYLVFATQQDSFEQALLHVKDLYNLKLNADLVVLSACETGLGKLQKGEGITSLARAFSYAGAKSIVTSLWSVNDQKTADLMEAFYQQLKHKENKAEALRQAKLSYIRANRDEHGHPFFWAAFIPLGDMEAITLDQEYNWRMITTLLLLSFISLWALAKKIFLRKV